MTQVHLLRHGRTTWQDAGRIQGSFVGAGEPVLTPTGRAQVAHAARGLLGPLGAGETCLVSSDLARAVESAAIVAEVLADARPARASMEPRTEPGWREQHLGAMEGRRPDELAPEAVPGGVEISEIRWGAGESLKDVHERVRPALAALSTVPSSVTDVVVVSHDHTIRVALAALRGHPRPWRSVDWDEPLPPGAVRTVTVPGPS